MIASTGAGSAWCVSVLATLPSQVTPMSFDRRIVVTGRSNQGCRFSSGAEVEAQLRAGAPWTMNRDIPDVSGWRDLVAAPEEVSECLKRRIADGRCPMHQTIVPLPKPGSNELRKVVWMDPFDELQYRILAGRMAGKMEEIVQRYGEVFSHRIIKVQPAWSVRHHQQAWRRFNKRSNKLLSKASCRAMGTFDIRHYYPSITPDKVASVLTSIGIRDEDIYQLDYFLNRLKELDAPSGLPIGAESSGLFGNIMLIEIDKALAPLVIGHTRFSDDSRVFLYDESMWDKIFEIYKVTADGLGLQMNESKSALYMKDSGAADQVINNERIDYLIASSTDGNVDPATAVDEIESQIQSDEPDFRIINFGLGVLIKYQSGLGLSVLHENPKIFEETPVNTGRYLCTLAAHGRFKTLIDHDWIVEIAATFSSGRSIAAQIHACRVAERLGVNKKHGERFAEVALSGGGNRNIPLRAWAAKAWGASEAYRPRAAVDHATDIGDFLLRRAFVLTIDPEASTDKNRQKWCRHLSVREPDLKPSLARLR